MQRLQLRVRELTCTAPRPILAACAQNDYYDGDVWDVEGLKSDLRLALSAAGERG